MQLVSISRTEWVIQLLTSCERFQVSVRADVWPVQDTGTWLPTLQATELCRGCSFLWFATLFFDKALETQGRKKLRQCVLEVWRCGLPSATVNSNAHCKDQCQHHQSYNDDQPVCRDRWGGKRACECISCGFAISQNYKDTISSTPFKMSHSFPSFRECLLGLQSLSVQIKHVFIIQLHTGSSD